MRFFLILLSFLFMSAVYAEEVVVQKPVATPQTVSQNIMFENCTRIFSISQEKLFYLTLASISANKFGINEIQSANGYVIFTANKNKFLATVSNIDKGNSILKITPCNNIYNFPPGVITNTFKYIDLNITTNG